MARESIIQDKLARQTGAIRFGHKVAASGKFKTLFSDGMALVENTATYLDGDGRSEARHLPRTAALAYAAESMRLTTRLMQIASWLLLQRAVNEGEMTEAEAAADKGRTRLAWQSVPPEQVAASGLPAGLMTLVEASLRVRERIVHLDRLIGDEETAPVGSPQSLEDQRSRLRDAFCS